MTDEARAGEPRTDLRVLLDAIETMDQKITPYGEREDGTILHYIVADSTWHRILAAARNPRWAAAAPSLDEPTLTRILGELAPVVGGDLMEGGVPYRVGLASAIVARLSESAPPVAPLGETP